MSKRMVHVEVSCPECGGKGRAYIDFDEYGTYYKPCKRCEGLGKTIIDIEVKEKTVIEKDGYSISVSKIEEKDVENDPQSEM